MAVGHCIFFVLCIDLSHFYFFLHNKQHRIWGTPHNAQISLLNLCSGITPGDVQGPIWRSMDQISCIQGKYFNSYTISIARGLWFDQRTGKLLPPHATSSLMLSKY